MRQLPDYKPSFPHWSATDLRNHVPTLDDDGIELLQLMLTYDTAKRISGTSVSRRNVSAYLFTEADYVAISSPPLAKRALIHPYLADFMPN